MKQLATFIWCIFGHRRWHRQERTYEFADGVAYYRTRCLRCEPPTPGEGAGE